MKYQLPLRNDLPHFHFETDLDGETYGFEFKWNDREGAWYMSVLDISENVVIAARKVVVRWPLLARISVAGLPPGMLYAVDTTGKDLDPGLSDLGARVQVFYLDASEVGST